jgi:crotonobetainyl-CoA:carnitine CoA-transferase CaiB-like acyl-CoA transferase
MSALADLKVLEIVDGIAGPITGMFLADFGADVVKIESADGDPSRAEAGFHVWNRGKRSVVAPVDGAEVRRLAERADVLLCRSVVDLAARGLDVAAVRAANPGLVVTETPPWEGAAPWLGGEESVELLSAGVGLAINQCSFTGGPIEFAEPQLLYVHGAWAAAATGAALFDRTRTGHGQVVTVTGAHAFAEFAPHLLVFDPSTPIGTRAFGPGGPNATYTAYQASDDRWFFVGALPDKFRRRIFSLLDADDVLDDPRIGQDTDRIFLPENAEWVRARLAEGFARKDRAHWLAAIEELDVPVAPLLNPADWFDHPQLPAIGGRVRVDHPLVGPIDLPGSPIGMSDTPADPARPAPALGSTAIADVTWPEAEKPGRDAPEPSPLGPLAGVRVISLGAYVAGPYSARLLGEFGAEVIKVEPAEGDPWRTHGFQVNDGMRGVALDIRNATGNAALHRLIDTADVVVDNFRVGVLTRLGIDHAQLSAKRPEIVTVSITGFGEAGPLSARPGFDPVLGALSGMQVQQGGDDEPVMFSLAVNDTATAALSAVGAVFALVHRARTGRGEHVSCSLAATATYLQNGSMVRYDGRPAARKGGRDFRGRDAHARYYRTGDGWLRIQSDAATLAAAAGELGVDPELFARNPIAALTVVFAERQTHTQVARLTELGVRSTAVRTCRDLAVDPVFAAVDVAHRVTLPDGYTYLTLGRLAHFSSRLPFEPMRPPGVGEETSAVLADIGLTEEEIDELLRSGVAQQGTRMLPRVLTQYR